MVEFSDSLLVSNNLIQCNPLTVVKHLQTRKPWGIQQGVWKSPIFPQGEKVVFFDNLHFIIFGHVNLDSIIHHSTTCVCVWHLVICSLFLLSGFSSGSVFVLKTLHSFVVKERLVWCLPSPLEVLLTSCLMLVVPVWESPKPERFPRLLGNPTVGFKFRFTGPSRSAFPTSHVWSQTGPSWHDVSICYEQGYWIQGEIIPSPRDLSLVYAVSQTETINWETEWKFLESYKYWGCVTQCWKG